MRPGKLLRRMLAVLSLSGAVAVLVACGSSPDLHKGPTPTPALDKSASCGPPSSKIGSVPRTGTHSFKTPPDMIIDPAKTYTATMKTTKGDMTIDLDAKDAPKTVNNFVFLACDGFYDGLLWHRVVNDPQNHFIIQGGDPKGDGSGGPGYIIDDEISPNIRFDQPGVLAMANAGPNTNGSQIFITLSPQPTLNDKYSAFGKVTSGQSAADNMVKGDKIINVTVQEK
jgi:peptidyl-prolyl cis-trans isomerase B (cyclophilin B)